MKKIVSNNKHGFTLVELLIVISLVGILTGVTLSILNPKKQRRVAEDGVRQSNLQKYALGIEAYANSTAKYPTAIVFDATTKIPTSPVDLATFVSKVPEDEPTLGTHYIYDFVAAAGVVPEYFAVIVYKTDSATSCYKYHSTWGKIRECSGANCTGANNGC